MSDTSTFRWSTEHLPELFTALAAAQKVMTGASKDALNPHFQNKYADLASVWDACRIPLADNGLSILQPVSCDGGKVTVTTLLVHVSGAWIASDLCMTTEKQTPQGIGSCITYGRRYGLSAMVGISPEDDDGNAASAGREAQQRMADKKLGKSRDDDTGSRAANEAVKPPAANFKFLGACADMKTAIGEKLYYGVLRANGFAKSTEVTKRPDEVKVYKAMGEVKKQIDACAEGILAPEMSQEVFVSMPEKHLTKAFASIRQRLTATLGSELTAGEEYETMRGSSSSQWDLFQKLIGLAEFYEGQKTA